MSLEFVHVVVYDRISFLFKVEQYSSICVNHILLIHSSVDGPLGCIHILAIANNGAKFISF